jgi:uncharacterized protein (DUF736 family)
MAYEQKPNTGSLFKNDRKETDQHPDYNGSINVNGVEMWLNAWLRTSANGRKYMSLSVRPKQQAAATTTGKTRSEDMGGDAVPF